MKDTVSALNLIGRKVDRLEISWIKAHVGHPGNERADELAREAATLDKDWTESQPHIASLKASC